MRRAREVPGPGHYKLPDLGCACAYSHLASPALRPPSFVCPSTQHSVHESIHPSIHHAYMHTSYAPTHHPSTHTYIHTSIHAHIHKQTSIHTYLDAFIHPGIHPYNHAIYSHTHPLADGGGAVLLGKFPTDVDIAMRRAAATPGPGKYPVRLYAPLHYNCGCVGSFCATPYYKWICACTYWTTLQYKCDFCRFVLVPHNITYR